MTVGNKIDAGIGKTKELGQKVVDKIKAGVTAIKSAGTKAKSHVSRNRAAYIAGGLAAVTGTAGGAALASRNRKPED
jgi:hypothetical protein